MAFISQDDREFLKEKFAAELKEQVHISLFTQPTSKLVIPGRRECQYCQTTQELLEEVVSLSDKMVLQVVDVTSQPEEAARAGVQRVPAIALGRDGASNIRYYGVPAGNEFPNFIQDIIHLSQGSSPLSEQARKRVNLIDEDVRITVFVTPT